MVVRVSDDLQHFEDCVTVTGMHITDSVKLIEDSVIIVVVFWGEGGGGASVN